MIAAAPVVRSLVVADITAAASNAAAPSIALLVSDINGDIPSKRQDAADQLVARAEAIPKIKQILGNSDNPPGQVVVAKALAKLLEPNPAVIPDLEALLGPDLDRTEPAAEALASMNYDQHPQVFGALQNFISNPANPQAARVSVIQSLGQIVQKPVADYLIQLLSAPGQRPAIIGAAISALTDLTGITSVGSNPRQWQQWWTGVQNLSAVEFRSRILQTRDLQFRRLKQRNALLLKTAEGYLEQNYLDLLSLDKAAARATLLSYLNDPSPEIRVTGVDSIDQTRTNAGVYAEGVRTKILTMIDDPDASVRLKVLKLLLDVNDHDAGKLLLARLRIETDLPISIEIIKALGNLEDPQAVPPLLDLLHDAQPEIVIAAANAIAHLGEKIRTTDDALTRKTADELHRVVDPPAGNSLARDDVQAACVAALAVLRDKQSFDLFGRLVQPAESSEVRQAALLGLGNLADTNANQFVIDQLDDTDKEVRAAAATALQTTATPDQADKIFRNMRSDPYTKVTGALWIALQNLYAKESPADLNRWAGDLAYDPEKQLFTLQKLGEAYATAKEAGSVAANQQAIADVMMKLNPPRTLEAIHNLQQALAYYRSSGNANPDTLEAIVGSLLSDELEARQWTDAARFAADQIKIDPVYQTTVGPLIKNTADSLSTINPDAANSLIDAALKMDPPLDLKYSGQLQQIRDGMKNRPVQPPG
jgi:HEAT repeat protein